MDLFPLYNSLRIALISTAIIFFAGIFAAYYIAKAPRVVKGVLDVILTLPLVLPPTVVGYLLLRILGPKRMICFESEVDDDLVVCHFRHSCGDFSSDVSHRQRCI